MGRTCYCCGDKQKQKCLICGDLLPENFFNKSKITISGFKDYNFNYSYSGVFDSGNFFGIILGYSTLYPRQDGWFIKGNATFKYSINISGLNQLNTSIEFERIESTFIPKDKYKFLGEIIVDTVVETKIDNGIAYAVFPEASYLGGGCSMVPCDLLEECYSGDGFSTPSNCLHTANVPADDWSGKIGSVYKYDVYLVAEPYDCSLGHTEGDPYHGIFTPYLGTSASYAPMIYFKIILKETNIVEDGIYKEIGHFIQQQIFEKCWQSTNNGCPSPSQQPCEGVIQKISSGCRNPLYSAFNLHGLAGQYNATDYRFTSDIVEKLYFEPKSCIGGRCFPGGGNLLASKPWRFCQYFTNHYNFIPFYVKPLFLVNRSRVIVHNGNCSDISSLPNLVSKSYFFYNDLQYNIDSTPLSGCYTDYDDPNYLCFNYNDADQTIKQKYNTHNNFSLNFTEDDYTVPNIDNLTDWSKIFNPCDMLNGVSNCGDLSNTTGVGVATNFGNGLTEDVPVNLLEYIFTKQMINPRFNSGGTSILKVPSDDKKCWDYKFFVPPPFGIWADRPIEFTKHTNSGIPGFMRFFCRTDYCHKTFINLPNLEWNQIPIENNQVTVGLRVSSFPVVGSAPYFILPKPPETILEVLYEK